VIGDTGSLLVVVALVSAAVLSVLIFPTLAIASRRAGGQPAETEPVVVVPGLEPA
jgi:hypothetical protein